MEERTELDHDNLTELTFTVDGWLELSSGVPSASLTIGSNRRVKRRAMPRDTIVSQEQEEWLEESDGIGEESDGTGEERAATVACAAWQLSRSDKRDSYREHV